MLSWFLLAQSRMVLVTMQQTSWKRWKNMVGTLVVFIFTCSFCHCLSSTFPPPPSHTTWFASFWELGIARKHIWVVVDKQHIHESLDTIKIRNKAIRKWLQCKRQLQLNGQVLFQSQLSTFEGSKGKHRMGWDDSSWEKRMSPLTVGRHVWPLFTAHRHNPQSSNWAGNRTWIFGTPINQGTLKLRREASSAGLLWVGTRLNQGFNLICFSMFFYLNEKPKIPNAILITLRDSSPQSTRGACRKTQMRVNPWISCISRGNVFPNTARFHARLGLMFSLKLSAQPLQMNFGATAHAAQLSLRGLNSEHIEQTVLGNKTEELFQRSWQSSGRNSVLITSILQNAMASKRSTSASCVRLAAIGCLLVYGFRNLTFSIPKQIQEIAQNRGISSVQYLEEVSNGAELYQKSPAIAGREEFVKKLNEAVRLSYPLFLMNLF